MRRQSLAQRGLRRVEARRDHDSPRRGLCGRQVGGECRDFVEHTEAMGLDAHHACMCSQLLDQPVERGFATGVTGSECTDVAISANLLLVVGLLPRVQQVQLNVECSVMLN